MRWTGIAICLLLAFSSVTILKYRSPKNSGSFVNVPRFLPVPAREAPTSTNPKPYGDVKVIFSEDESSITSNRLQVAEIPQGHMIYPYAPDSKLIGTVGMKAVIATDGRVKEIHILKGNRILAAAAIQAVRFWHYTSHELNGKAVEAETHVTFTFHGQDAVSISFAPPASSAGLPQKTS